jgi:CDP-diglyceride synthetase
MLKRFITGILLAAFVVCMVYFGATNYIFFDLLILAFSTVGCYEIFKSLRTAGYKNEWLPLLLEALAIYPLWHFLGERGLLLTFAVCVMVALTVFTFRQESEAKDLFATLFSLLYPYGFIALAFMLTKEHCAVFSISYAIFVSVAADTFAYLLGSLIKGPKLCPSISPKKTIAGGIGGLFGAMLTSVVFFLLFEFYGVIDCGYVPFTDKVGASVAIYLALGFFGRHRRRVG